MITYWGEHMTTRTVEIDDDLDERIENVIDEVKYKLVDEAEGEPDAYSSFDDFLQRGLEYDGTLHELVDSAVPIYTSDINGLFYLYGSEFEQAYEDAGCYDERPDNYEAVCIYFYIEQEVHRILSDDIAPIYDEWLLLPTPDEVEEDEADDENYKYNGEIRTAELLKDMLG